MTGFALRISPSGKAVAFRHRGALCGVDEIRPESRQWIAGQTLPALHEIRIEDRPTANETAGPRAALEYNASLTAKGTRSADADRGIVLLGCLLGLVIQLPSVAPLFHNASIRDFTGFFIGAKLLGTDRLYDVPANLALQRELIGGTDPGIIFVRPPFWAAVIKPFTLLPYPRALLLWQAITAAALVPFAIWFPPVKPRYTALALCWYRPVVWAVGMGQEVTLSVLCIGLSILAWQKRRPVLAGILLASCLAKFYVLLYLPLLLVRRRYWGVLAGLGGMTLLAFGVNFLVQPAWLRLYGSALTLPAGNMNASLAATPNFRSLFAWTGYPGAGVILGMAVVLALLWRLCGRAPFAVAMPMCIAGGVVAAYHANFTDAALFVPAFLAVAAIRRELQVPVLFFLSPLGLIILALTAPAIGAATFVLPYVWIAWRFSAGTPVPDLAAPSVPT